MIIVGGGSISYYSEIKEMLLKNEIYKRAKDYSKNKSDLNTYFEVGKLLVEAQGGENRAKYGNKLIKEYSERLTKELGKGYDVSNLKRMRKFYLIFNKGGTLSHQLDGLTWSHVYKLLVISDESERSYYIYLIKKLGISVRELSKKIKSNEYERIGYKEELEEPKINTLIKNPIIIESKTSVVVNEYTLKSLILENLDDFLSELGIGFTYVGNEFKIKIGDSYHYIDLLLFNFKFNCFVVIELKVTKMQAEYIGQVTKYINYVDKNIKGSCNDKTVGVIICKRENKFILEYISDERIFQTLYQIIKV
ncbi:MAG: PDDEXK nuclease domain-containing protein [Bacilli bacterium]